VTSNVEKPIANVDVLCVGHASYDLVFSVSHHPAEDEKIFADAFLACGGGPAANAAVTAARLGFTASFAGYLGHDLYGEKHYQELVGQGIDTHLVVRGLSPTPLSTILVKPGGKRALINYKGETQALPAEALDFSSIRPKAVLFDGHEPLLSVSLAQRTRREGIPSVLDAGSVHEGTLALMELVDYLVCSEKFACQLAGDEEKALIQLAKISPAVVLELEYLHEIGRLAVGGNAITQGLSAQLGLSVCDRPFAAVVEAALDQDWTRDPFDRLIVGQAALSGSTLLTKDQTIRSHYRNAAW